MFLKGRGFKDIYIYNQLQNPNKLTPGTIWHWTIWHQHNKADNLAPGQFGTRQFGTRTIWHQHNKNRQFGTGQFGTRTIWHQPHKTDNLAPREK